MMLNNILEVFNLLSFESQYLGACRIDTTLAHSYIQLEHIKMDLITHLPTIDAGYDSGYTVVDHLSKYVYFLPCNITVSADESTYLYLANIICSYDTPKPIICDHDLYYTSIFRIYLINSLGCQQSLSIVYCPKIGRQLENFYHSIKQALHYCVPANQKDWDSFLALCQFVLNSTQSFTTVYSPVAAVFGREPMLPMEYNVQAITDGKVEFVVSQLDHIAVIKKPVQASVIKGNEYMALYANITFIGDRKF